ncbi:MAG: hypothetical protein KBS68_01995 [Clostridiales bacterium]|nr:hypothetical protein [Candidatus Crickella merdequi]
MLSPDNIRKTLVLLQQSADEVIVVRKEELPVEQYLLNHIIITLVQKLYMDEVFRGLADSEKSE